jgi:hypothetical protein
VFTQKRDLSLLHFGRQVAEPHDVKCAFHPIEFGIRDPLVRGLGVCVPYVSIRGPVNDQGWTADLIEGQRALHDPIALLQWESLIYEPLARSHDPA